MSFLDGSSQSALLDCSEGDMKAGAWGGADLLDPGGDAADFDISSFFSQLAASTTGVEAAHSTDGLCGAGEVPVPPPDGEQLCAAGDTGEEASHTAVADVSLSALLGEHAELQEALLAASGPLPPPAAGKGKTFVVVKKQQQQQHEPQHDRPVGRRRRRTGPPYGRPPRAPLSAYSLFFKEQYAQMKSKWRALNRSRAVPRLSKRWGGMTPEEKEPYQRRADEEKNEYRTQLAQYRQRARLWRRHQASASASEASGDTAAAAEVEVAEAVAHVDSELDPAVTRCKAEAVTAIEMTRVDRAEEEEEEEPAEGTARCPSSAEEDQGEDEVHSDDDPADLFCGLCQLYFSSSHNKQQHLMSRKHVRQMAQQAVAREVPSAPGPADCCPEAAADVPAALETVLLSVSRRESEIRFLAEFSAGLRRRQQQLQQELGQLEARRAAAVTSQQSVTSEHRQLTEQVQGLLLVPTLFGVMSQWSRDAQRAANAISIRQGQLEV